MSKESKLIYYSILISTIVLFIVVIIKGLLHFQNKIDKHDLLFHKRFKEELIHNKFLIESIVNQLFEEKQKIINAFIKNERAGQQNGNIFSYIYPEVSRRKRELLSTTRYGEAIVDIFNPNYRKELEQQENEFRRRTGQKGTAPGGDEWIYLNSYCRVPEKIMFGFCKATQEYCPPSTPGSQGPVGPLGQKGSRGDVGLPGPPGINGQNGLPGLKGAKGSQGIAGIPGLDGRDGVPGEPGLDGVPGRAGTDGIPGKDGKDGSQGKDGRDGQNGKDGSAGLKGASGPAGEKGIKGIPGPRGRPGKPGINGAPGIPGINAWKVKINGTLSNELLIPPSISDNYGVNKSRTVIVEEGKNVRLSCAANGNPLPNIEWRRLDGKTITMNREELSSVSGQILNFVNVSRHHMATYTCFADNGIPPTTHAGFSLEVHFPPIIYVFQQIIFSIEGESATVECQVEAFPDPIKYWERASDGKILDPSEKYRIESYPDRYRTTMRLTIQNINVMDFGQYFCVAKNELNTTMATFEIIKKNPALQTPLIRNDLKVYGIKPPDVICPPLVVCKKCPDLSEKSCKDDAVSNFNMKPTGNYSYPGLPRRETNCILYAVGKPVFHKFTDETYGSWLKDSAANTKDKDKLYSTRENVTNRLYEYTNKIEYRGSSLSTKYYEIKEGFEGNAHVVYNGSFYYNQENTDVVVKLDLSTLRKTTVKLPFSGVSTGNRLYSTNFNFMDFNMDDVGLWVIYSTFDSNNTLVAKINSESLEIQFNWNITIDHHKFGEMFIICGVLYAIDSVTERNSKIRIAIDLYKAKFISVDLPFSNPFRKTTSVGYNHLYGELYSWDKGNQLTYPIRYHVELLETDKGSTY